MRASPRASIAALFVVATLVAPARAEVPPGLIPWIAYDEKDGFERWSIRSLAQDTRGMLWIGTDAGLFRYDGRRVRPIASLGSRFFRNLAAGRRGDMWCVTSDGALLWHEGSWKAIDAPAQTPLRVLTTDSEGRAWAGSAAGLFREGDDGVLALAPGWSNGPVTAIWTEPSRDVYVAGHGVVTRRSPDGSIRTWGAKEGIPDEGFDGVAHDAGGRIWLHTHRRLWALSPDTGELQDRSELAGGSALAGFGGNGGGSVWVALARGMIEITASGAVRHVLAEKIGPVRALLVDHEGSLWAGSNGLFRAAGRGLFRVHSTRDGLPDNRIWSMRRDEAGRLWAGTGKGLSRATAQGWQSESAAPLITVASIVPAPGGLLWLAGTSTKVFRYDPSTGALDSFPTQDATTNAVVFALDFDRSGAMWAATSTGLFRGSDAGAGLQFTRIMPPPSQPDVMVTDIHKDRHGRVWVAASDGLAVVEDGVLGRIPADAGLRRQGIISVTERRDGSICVAYSLATGVSCFRYESHALRDLIHFDMTNGLSSDAIYLLEEDRAGRLWVGSGHGVDVIEQSVVTSFSAAEGMPGNDVNAHAFWADEGGDVWIGTSAGIGQFLGSRYGGPLSPPKAELIAIRAGERELPIGVGAPELLHRESSLEAEIAVPSFVDAPRIEREIRLLGLDSTWRRDDDDQVRYGFLDPGAYELQVRARRPHGAWGASAAFSFTVVPPWWRTWWFRAGAAVALAGAVVLMTRRKQAELRRHNKWLATLVEQRTRALREAHERMVELEKDATEHQMAGGFAHEMRNALTGAQILLRSVGGADAAAASKQLCDANTEALAEIYAWVRSHATPEERRMLLSLFKRINGNEAQIDTALHDIDEALTRALAATQSILDYARLGREAPGDEPASAELLVDAILKEMREDLARHGIRVEKVSDPDAAPIVKASHLYSILKNLMLNARDALIEKDGERVLRVVIAEEQAGWTIRVEDTGIGIPEAQRSRIFEPFFSTKPETGTGLGLGVVRKLVSIYGGTIELESEAGQGTRVQITLPRRSVPAKS